MKIKIEIDVTKEELIGILVTAVEGGSNYWARFRKYDHEKGRVEVSERDQDTAEKPGWHKVRLEDIARGLELAAQDEPKTFEHWYGDRCGDASSADSILQLAFFGELVYG